MRLYLHETKVQGVLLIFGVLIYNIVNYIFIKNLSNAQFSKFLVTDVMIN